MKKALVLRWGGIGDLIMTTPVFPLLKAEGYEVHFHTNKRGPHVVKNNPFVDKVILDPNDGKYPKEEVQGIWDKLGEGYDRYCNCSGSVEGSLLPSSASESYHLPHEERHRLLNVNYYDHTLKWAGFDVTGKSGKLYIDEDEERFFRSWMKTNFKKDHFVVLWAMSGSSHHKAYPWTDFVVEELRKRIPGIRFITTGDGWCRLIEFEGKDTINTAGRWPIRRAILMPRFVDLVIGPETGTLNAAGCFATPKIVFLSHSSPENLTKYWRNCVSLEAPPEIKCHPCHRLIFSRDECDTTMLSKTAPCIANIRPVDLIRAIEDFYHNRRIRRPA